MVLVAAWPPDDAACSPSWPHILFSYCSPFFPLVFLQNKFGVGQRDPPGSFGKEGATVPLKGTLQKLISRVVYISGSLPRASGHHLLLLDNTWHSWLGTLAGCHSVFWPSILSQGFNTETLSTSGYKWLFSSISKLDKYKGYFHRGCFGEVPLIKNIVKRIFINGEEGIYYSHYTLLQGLQLVSFL